MFPDKLPVCFVSFARPIDLNRPSVLSEAVLQRPSTYRKKGLQGLTVPDENPPFSPLIR